MRLLTFFCLLWSSSIACTSPDPDTGDTGDTGEVTGLSTSPGVLPMCLVYGCIRPSGSYGIYTECTDNDCWCRLDPESPGARLVCGDPGRLDCEMECRLTDACSGSGCGGDPSE